MEAKMALNKLNGWQRIKIVLLVIWTAYIALCIAGGAAVELGALRVFLWWLAPIAAMYALVRTAKWIIAGFRR